MLETRIAAATSPTVRSDPPPGTKAALESPIAIPLLRSDRSRLNLPRPDVAPVSQVPHLPHSIHRSSGSPESRLTKHQGSGQVKHPDEFISAGRTPVRHRTLVRARRYRAPQVRGRCAPMPS